MKKSFLACVFLVLGGCLTAQTFSVQQLTENMTAAFQQKADSVLRPFIDEGFSIGTYSGRSAKYNLVTILNNYACDSVSLHKNLSPGKAAVLFHKKDKTDTSLLHITGEGKLMGIDLFDELYGMYRNQASKHLVSIPFEDVNGSIILQVKINKYKKPLRLLFDTGADGMMVGKAIADSIGLNVDKKQQASVVGGNIHIEISSDNTVFLDTFPVRQQSIAIFDRGGWEDHDGIIGNTLARKYIVQVNYDTKTVSLYSFGNTPKPDKSITVPVNASEGSLQMDAELTVQPENPVAAKFIFDTGAQYYLMVFRPLVRKHKLLVNGFVPDSTGSTVSLGVASPVFHGRSAQFRLLPNLAIKKMPVTLMGGTASNANWNPGIDGSVGIKLISQYNFTINLMDKNIYLVPNHKLEKPIQ